MSNNITVGKYFPADSNIHSMNPLSKIICTVLFIIIALVNNDFQISGFLSLLVMIMIMNTDVPLIIYYQIIKSLRHIFLLVFIIFGILTLSFGGALLALINTLVIIIYISILTLTTPPTEIIYGFEKLLYPLNKLGVKVNRVALNIGLGLKFVPTMIDQSSKILKAEASRGVDYHTSPRNYYLAFKGMVVPAVTLSVQKLKQLKQAMELRLFGMEKDRTNFRINKWGLFDSYLLLIHFAILVVIIMRGVIT